MTPRRPISLLFLLALSVLTFIPLLGKRDIVTSHEARVVQVARQMAESGWPWDAKPVSVPQVSLQQTEQGDRLLPKADGSTLAVNPWIVPVMNGQIRLQKPPLPYWCAAILYRLMGYNEFTSRLLPAIFGAISVLILWDLARRMIGNIGAWYAGLAWVSSYFIVDEFRKAMADPYLAFFVLASFWAWVRGWRIFFYVMLALGVLSKGPLIFLFVVVMAVIYEWSDRVSSTEPSPTPLPEYRARVFGWKGHLVGLIVFLVLVLPWGIAILRAVPNAMELWRYESVGALSDKLEDMRPWWFYLPNLLLISLPWTPLWLIGMVVPFVHRRRRRWFPILTTTLIVSVFSLSHGKKNAYLLPLAPIQCLIIAQGMIWLPAMQHRWELRRTLKTATAMAVVFSVAIGIFLGFQTWKDNNRSPRDACLFISKLIAESPRRSILVSKMPEDATVYLPLGVRDSTDSDEVYVVLDNRKDDAQIRAEAITTTLAGSVESRELLPIPDSKITRWKVYRLKISPVQRPAPGAG